jgi:molybdate transport system substrate-binding protein
MTVTLRILSTHAAMDVLDEVKPGFERDTGVTLSLGYDPGRAVRRTLENGGFCDVAIVPLPVFDALVAQNMMLADSRADVGRCGLGVSVRQGAPVPDISTPEALKAAFLAAKSVVRSTDGPAASISKRSPTVSASPNKCAARSSWVLQAASPNLWHAAKPNWQSSRSQS